MSITFKDALGIHEQALTVREKRAEVLANNLANADTPNFKARDLDFAALLKGQLSMAGREGMGLNRTASAHQSGIASEDDIPGMVYRVPLQPSLDGNTVDEQVEQAAYARNALEFQASFTMLNRRFKGLISALKGE